jgi:hypothetical protein
VASAADAYTAHRQVADPAIDAFLLLWSDGIELLHCRKQVIVRKCGELT